MTKPRFNYDILRKGGAHEKSYKARRRQDNMDLRDLDDEIEPGTNSVVEDTNEKIQMGEPGITIAANR